LQKPYDFTMEARMKSEPAFSLELGLAIATAAQRHAREKNLPGITIVVLDMDGAIRVALREDPQGTFGIDVALAKARTALGFLSSSLAISKMFSDPIPVTGLTAATDGKFLPIAGGVVVNDATGRRIGAAAVAGGPPQIDHDIVCAAVESAGLTVQAE
jgi:uncharacterized protein GlcG (DUF336 family)